MNNRISNLYEFGKFRPDAAEHLLLRQGKPIQLTSKAFQTLLVLVQDNVAGAALWVQPIAGGSPRQVINLAQDDLLYWVAWSRDAKELAFAHGRFLMDIIWLTRDKAQP